MGALAVLGVLLMVLAPRADAGQPNGGPPKPTIVLVHGAFADASSWSGVVTRLQRAGYPVVAPANPLRGLASDATYLDSVLHTIPGPVILVGHSYGGAVITQAAAAAPNVKALVYVAAFAPTVGESAFGLIGMNPGSALPTAVTSLPFAGTGGDDGVDVYINSARFSQVFAADLPATTAAVLAASQRPVTLSALQESATSAAWKTIPSWYLVASADQAIPPATERFMARRAGAHTAEVNASHAVLISRPDAVTGLIESASRGVA
ncbi:alpha/beta fold hydrolase [Pseudofrankia inefficax]|nr:alpha/beta hydrolase [Pseudofrankia inefficax]